MLAQEPTAKFRATLHRPQERVSHLTLTGERHISLNSANHISICAEDPATLAQAVARLSADPETARAMGERGRCAVLGAQSWDVRAGETHEVQLALGWGENRKDAG